MAKPQQRAAAWSDLLDRVQRTVTQTQLEADERERALGPAPAAPEPEHAAAWKQRLELFDERLRGLQTCVRQAEETAQQTGSSLALVEQSLNVWLAAVEAIRRRLAEL